MIISFHIGAHCTDEGQLLKSLSKNGNILEREAVALPKPGVFRKVIREAQMTLQGAPATAEMQDAMLEAMGVAEETERLVLTHENLICVPGRVLAEGRLYAAAAEKSLWLRNLFPDDEVEFFLSVRDPATFVPVLYEKVPDVSFEEFSQGLATEHLIWSDVVHDIRDANPDSPITVWCNEDTPLIWPEVMHELTGLDPQIQLKGGLDILSQIMEKEGMTRLRAYMKSHPSANEIQRRRVLAAFLDKYAIDEAIEQELDLPGWDEDRIEALTSAYDDDMYEIARVPGVTLLTA